MQRSGSTKPPSGWKTTGRSGGKTVRGEAPADLAPVDRLVREVVLAARPERAVVDPIAGLDDARHVQEPLARLRLELAPELVRPAHERDVRDVLEVREADDPRQAVLRGPVLVRDVEALEPQHALAPAREVVERGAAHTSDPDDDDVVPLHPRVTLSPAG